MTRGTNSANWRLGIERREKIYEILVHRAENGLPMLSNEALCRRIGIFVDSKWSSAIGRNLNALIKSGLITVERGVTTSDRRVVICATGKRTGWQLRQRYTATKAKPKPKPGKKWVDRPLAYVSPRPMAAGYSDTFLYGHLADSVRACRRKGDVVYRNPNDKTQILINGVARDPKERAQWHASRAQIQPMNL